jgi:hypothetical protein
LRGPRRQHLGTPYLGRFTWDALSGTLYLGRFCR